MENQHKPKVFATLSVLLLLQLTWLLGTAQGSAHNSSSNNSGLLNMCIRPSIWPGVVKLKNGHATVYDPGHQPWNFLVENYATGNLTPHQFGGALGIGYTFGGNGTTSDLVVARKQGGGYKALETVCFGFGRFESITIANNIIKVEFSSPAIPGDKWGTWITEHRSFKMRANKLCLIAERTIPHVQGENVSPAGNSR